MTWPNLLSALLAGDSLSAADTAWAMAEIMDGAATPAQVAGFAVALRAKGETVEEVNGLVHSMLGHAARLELSGPMVDTCGTGGDRAATVNISTMAALVVRGAGATVVKHGNRAASSACGSADLLEELGVAVDLAPEAVQRCIETAGIGFCFAPVFHPALRHAGPTRRELGVPTFFNFLGPLTNPAQPPAQAVGVADERMAGVMAGVLAARGTSALVFRGTDGLDELSVAVPSRVWVVADGLVRDDVVDPADLGFDPAAPDALRGADAAHNAGVTRRLLEGETGPVRDAVVLNAAAALVALDGPTSAPVTEQLAAAVPRAAAALDSGAAGQALDAWVAACQT
ncbi:MAG: anthranilate phosphoribosyltransferase [Frankiaceae bacterium]|nr:anthranilate phosphoribosyltransferase [Frankiaceae bacterium]MBV9871447.1 anthranilate phosphoribosyltransferase [Frankiaceae bacterium]